MSRRWVLTPWMGRDSNHFKTALSISESSVGRGSGCGLSLDGTSNDAAALLLSGAELLYLGALLRIRDGKRTHALSFFGRRRCRWVYACKKSRVRQQRQNGAQKKLQGHLATTPSRAAWKSAIHLAWLVLVDGLSAFMIVKPR
jgi:hypothetical protein